MKSNTEKLMVFMNVLAWITFIGILFEAGATLCTYGLSAGGIFTTKQLYPVYDLPTVRDYSFQHYTALVFIKFAIHAVQAYAAYLVIKILSAIKMTNPFTAEISNQMLQIGHFIFYSWLLVVAHNIYVEWLQEKIVQLNVSEISSDFIFLAMVVYLFAKIFQRGVEIQAENDLTV